MDQCGRKIIYACCAFTKRTRMRVDVALAPSNFISFIHFIYLSRPCPVKKCKEMPSEEMPCEDVPCEEVLCEEVPCEEVPCEEL